MFYLYQRKQFQEYKTKLLRSSFLNKNNWTQKSNNIFFINFLQTLCNVLNLWLKGAVQRRKTFSRKRDFRVYHNSQFHILFVERLWTTHFFRFFFPPFKKKLFRSFLKLSFIFQLFPSFKDCSVKSYVSKIGCSIKLFVQ